MNGCRKEWEKNSKSKRKRRWRKSSNLLKSFKTNNSGR